MVCVLLLLQSEPNPKPMPGMERNGKIIVSVAGVGKQRFDVWKNGEALQVEKKSGRRTPHDHSE
jgi:hypothetical protein